MPFEVKKSGDKWQTINADTDKVYGTHASEKEARAQMKALYANVKDASESGVYSVSLSEDELNSYADGLSESVPKDAPESDFADPPRGLYVGDAKHARLAVQAVTSGFRGNKAKARGNPGVKSKIAAAIRKFYSGDQAKYYLSWLHSGRKPDEKPEMHVQEMYIAAPTYSFEDEARFPDPPISPGVNLDMLTRGDPSPKFVTRPLAILDEVSRNGLDYNQAILDDVYSQVRDKRVAARRGHVSAVDKSSSFPPDEGYWVGVLLDESFYGKPAVFGKCYLKHGQPLKEMVLDREAVGGTISNSLWGDVTYAQDAYGTLTPVGITLETIDFVPEERAALEALGGDFVVTSEMKEDIMAEHDDAAADLDLFKKAVASLKPEALHEALHEAGRSHGMAAMHLKSGGCAECTGAVMREMLSEGIRKEVAEGVLSEMADPNEVYAKLSEAQRQAVAEAFTKEKGMTMKAASEEARVQESVAEMVTFKAQLSEMVTTIKTLSESNKAQGQIIARYEREDFERELDKEVDTFFTAVPMKTPKGITGLAQIKRTLRKGALAEMAGMENGQTPENIKASVAAVWESDVKGLAEMFYASVSGPSAVTGGAPGQSNPYGWDPQTGRYSDEAVRAATTQTGVLGGRSAGGVK